MTSQSKQAYLEQAEKIEKALAELPAEHPLRAMLFESASLLAQAGACSDNDTTGRESGNGRWNYLALNPIACG